MAAYPLEALRTLRADEEEAARRALAAAVRAHEEAVAVTSAAEARRVAHASATDAAIEKESARPLALLRPSDATQLRAWRVRRREELAALDAQVSEAKAREAELAKAAELSRDALATARREREAIEKHHARWAEQVRRAAEAKEEAEAEDRRR